VTPEEIVAQAMQKRRDPKFMAAGSPPSAICRGEAITAVRALREAGFRIAKQREVLVVSGDIVERGPRPGVYPVVFHDVEFWPVWVDVSDGAR